FVLELTWFLEAVWTSSDWPLPSTLGAFPRPRFHQPPVVREQIQPIVHGGVTIGADLIEYDFSLVPRTEVVGAPMGTLTIQLNEASARPASERYPIHYELLAGPHGGDWPDKPSEHVKPTRRKPKRSRALKAR